MKVASIVGARPQFIKVAPVSRELRQRHTEVLIHTGQHYDPLLSDIFFEELGIPHPDYNLEVGSALHGRQTGEMLARIEETLLAEKPDWVLVYGDTNSTLAGALAAVKLHIPVAHVEAGLRSYNRAMPEEINRLVTDHISTLLFCPTERALINLEREGIRNGAYNVGDVMYDALLHNLKLASAQSRVLSRLGLRPKGYFLATVHRPSNTDDMANLQGILTAFNALDDIVVFPIHPRTQQALAAAKIEPGPNVLAIEPVSYLDMLTLEANARAILTDSGGVQKEAYLIGVPCVTLRQDTEWIETVEAGWNILAGASPEEILQAVKRLNPPDDRPNPFGDGRASWRIVSLLEDRA